MQRELKESLRSWSNNSFNKANILSDYSGEVRDIHTRLREAGKILIVTHEHPDGDAVGSSLALMHALRLQGKEVAVFIADPAPETLEFLPGFSELTHDALDPQAYDVVVVLDATYIGRTRIADRLQDHPSVICIDHHHDNKGEGHLNLIIEESAATAQILALFFEQTGTPITTDMATCLLTGIFTDTGSFMHDSTTPDILKLAASLMSKGARLSHIAHETYQRKGLPGLRIWGKALSRSMTNGETGVTVSVVTYEDLKETGAELDDLSGVVNMLNTLPSTKFALLLCEYKPGKIKGSLRSEPHKGIDVSRIAKKLGGGGHKLAAGFEVEGRLVQRDGEWRVERIK